MNQQNPSKWYVCPTDKKTIKRLSRRTNTDGLIRLTGFVTAVLFGAWLAFESLGTVFVIPAFLIYGRVWVMATSVVHETCHGMAFRSRWLNETVLFISGLMVQQPPTVIRYTHANHHSHTAINGEDIEILVSTPLTWSGLFIKELIDIGSFWYYVKINIMMFFGIADADIKKSVPANEIKKAVWECRAYVLIYMFIILWAVVIESWLPIVMLLLPRLFVGPMHGILLVTQHLGLAQDVRDYRQSTRTMLLNPLLKFLY